MIEAKGEPIPVDKLIKEDAKTKQRVAELAKPLEKIRQKVVGFTKNPIDGDGENCRVAECTMGTLVTDALLSRFKPQGAEIAIINGGGLRASINAGPITMGEVLEVLPFQNTVATFSMTGADIVTSLESGVSRIEDLEGRFPQVAGLRYAVNASKKAGSRISKVHAKINGEWTPIDANRHYNIVTIDFLRTGGDGYELFDSKAKDPYDFGPNIENVVADYLISAGDYEPTLRGEIIVE
ncbi:MAG: 5'-nucleotidase [Hyphomicrobiales bacterium]